MWFLCYHQNCSYTKRIVYAQKVRIEAISWSLFILNSLSFFYYPLEIQYTVQCLKRHSENSAFFNGMICTEPRAPVMISWNERNISKLKIAWEQFWRRWKLTLRLRFTPTFIFDEFILYMTNLFCLLNMKNLFCLLSHSFLAA